MSASKIIMTVDDSSSVRRVIRQVLEANGYLVLEASDGQEALEQLNGQKIDLLISDVNMPRVDGLSLVRQVRTRESYQFIPILMLTTESSEAMRQAGKQAGATGWIVKPFVAAELLKIVKRVLG